MFRYLRVRRETPKIAPLPGMLSAEALERDAESPITLRHINNLPENTRRRAYRGLLPASLLAYFKIDLISWKAAQDRYRIVLNAGPDNGVVKVTISDPADETDVFVALEMQDNAFGSIDVNLLLLADPAAPRFCTDYDADGNPTLFGSLSRNLEAERCAMQAGLAPGQGRAGLGFSRAVLEQAEAFLAVLGHRACFLEPLTYVSAWLFERRGFAYVRGHKLMDDIHTGFQPGGPLHAALDGSTPFRTPQQWNTVRGRAWAIHDGILACTGQRWDGLRMVKQIGHSAGVETFPEAVY